MRPGCPPSSTTRPRWAASSSTSAAARRRAACSPTAPRSAPVAGGAAMGCGVVDLGGGTTTVGVFANGHVVHVDAFAVGGHHITMDIARGLTTRVAVAERLKTLHGSCILSSSDDRDTITVPPVDDDGGGAGRD